MLSIQYNVFFLKGHIHSTKIICISTLLGVNVSVNLCCFIQISLRFKTSFYLCVCEHYVLYHRFLTAHACRVKYFQKVKFFWRRFYQGTEVIRYLNNLGLDSKKILIISCFLRGRNLPIK